EIDRDAARVCAARLPKGSRTINAPVEDALAKALPADVVILNPPRAGLDPRIPQILSPRAENRPAAPRAAGPRTVIPEILSPRAENRPGRRPGPRTIIYVSCNPATLARDVRHMESFRIQSMRA